jgi:hypothetical protein
MSFHQLSPSIPVIVIGKGDGYAVAVIDDGQEHNLIWGTALDESAEVWSAPNPLVRMKGNWTMGRERVAFGQHQSVLGPDSANGMTGSYQPTGFFQ